MKVSLDKYRTKGVKVFSGEGRGKMVALRIKRDYGTNVEIVIPPGTYAVTRSFRRGFNDVLPNKLNKDEN